MPSGKPLLEITRVDNFMFSVCTQSLKQVSVDAPPEPVDRTVGQHELRSQCGDDRVSNRVFLLCQATDDKTV
jgi:hypothetical protein